MTEPDMTTEAGRFADGMLGTLNNVQHEIAMITERLEHKMHLYPGMDATYRGMVAAWRICETALMNATKEQGATR